MSNLCLYSAFDPTTIHLGPATKNGKGAPTVPVHAQGGQKRIVLQTPAILAPFGLSAYAQNPNELPNYTIDVSFKHADSDPKVAQFLALMRKLDETVLAAAKARYKEWDIKKDFVEAYFKPLVTDNKINKTTGAIYPPQMKTKVPLRDGNVNIAVYDENQKPVSPDYITKGSTVSLIIELCNVWFMGKTQFGVNWRVLQVQVKDRPEVQGGYGFLDDGATNDEPALEG